MRLRGTGGLVLVGFEVILWIVGKVGCLTFGTLAHLIWYISPSDLVHCTIDFGTLYLWR